MIEIEKLKEGDVEAYHALIGKVISGTPYYSPKARKAEIEGYTLEWIKSGIQKEKKLFLCAKEGEKVVGFLFGYISTGMLHVIWVGVDSNYRKQGTAQNLIRVAEKWAKKKVHKIWFDTRINNKQSIPLVRKLKYRKVATLKKHYYAQDFFIWEKLLK